MSKKNGCKSVDATNARHVERGCGLFPKKHSRLVMSLAPSPSVSRGAIIIQPSYFTSSVYVNPLREDISTLIDAYSHRYTHTAPTQPFALFKSTWSIQGWTWMHLKVFDARSRDTFLRVTYRLFLGQGYYSSYQLRPNFPCRREDGLD